MNELRLSDGERRGPGPRQPQRRRRALAGREGGVLRATVTANADTFAQTLAPTLADIQARGHTTLRAIAAELNSRDILARRGGKWHVSSVKRLVERLATRARSGAAGTPKRGR